MNAKASRRSRLARALLGLVPLALAQASPAAAILVFPGQALEIPFAWSSPPLVSGGVVDTLTLTLGSGSSASGLDAISVSLFDGQTLLGQVTTGPAARIFGFADTGSLWTLNADLGVDLSSVRSGGIDGRLLVTPLFTAGAEDPFFEVLIPVFPAVQAGRGTQAAGLLSASPEPLLGTPVVVPEPASAALLAGALALLALSRPR